MYGHVTYKGRSGLTISKSRMMHVLALSSHAVPLLPSRSLQEPELLGNDQVPNQLQSLQNSCSSLALPAVMISHVAAQSASSTAARSLLPVLVPQSSQGGHSLFRTRMQSDTEVLLQVRADPIPLSSPLRIILRHDGWSRSAVGDGSVDGVRVGSSSLGSKVDPTRAISWAVVAWREIHTTTDTSRTRSRARDRCRRDGTCGCTATLAHPLL